MRIGNCILWVWDFFRACEGWEEDGHFARARDKTDVLVWFLNHWLRDNPVEHLGINEVFVQFRASGAGDEVVWSDRKAIVRLAVPHPGDPALLQNEAAFYEFIMSAGSRALGLLVADGHAAVAAISDGFAAFAAAGYGFQRVIALRRFRGTGLEVRIVQQVDTRAASARLEILKQGVIQHAEILSQTEPRHFLWSGKLRKLDLTDGVLRVVGTIPTSLPLEKLARQQHGDLSGKLKVLEFYTWSRPLAELGLD
jgi:hypothetical protein